MDPELGEEISPTQPDQPEDASDSMRRLEAALFLTKTPLHSRKLAELANLTDGTQARTLVRRLRSAYDHHGTAFQIKRVAGGYQLRTRPQFSPWLKRIRQSPTRERLTSPAMETLAVVAYRQPVIKADVEAVRGVGCGELLRQMLERGLIKIAGRSPELGHPFLYVTTKRFLEVFGLASLDALPRADQLRAQGLPNWPTQAILATENRNENAATPLDEQHSTPDNQPTMTMDRISDLETSEEESQEEDLQ